MANLTSQQRQELIEELPRLKRFCLSLTSDLADADDLLQPHSRALAGKGYARGCTCGQVVTPSMPQLVD